MLLYHFYCNFILFVNTGHADFDFDWFLHVWNFVFSFEKGLNDQNHSSSDSHDPIQNLFLISSIILIKSNFDILFIKKETVKTNIVVIVFKNCHIVLQLKIQTLFYLLKVVIEKTSWNDIFTSKILPIIMEKQILFPVELREKGT